MVTYCFTDVATTPQLGHPAAAVSSAVSTCTTPAAMLILLDTPHPHSGQSEQHRRSVTQARRLRLLRRRADRFSTGHGPWHQARREGHEPAGCPVKIEEPVCRRAATNEQGRKAQARQVRCRHRPPGPGLSGQFHARVDHRTLRPPRGTRCRYGLSRVFAEGLHEPRARPCQQASVLLALPGAASRGSSQSLSVPRAGSTQIFGHRNQTADSAGQGAAGHNRSTLLKTATRSFSYPPNSGGAARPLAVVVAEEFRRLLRRYRPAGSHRHGGGRRAGSGGCCDRAKRLPAG